MKHAKGVVDDERPTKENKREVRGVELTFSRVDVHRCCPLATYTTHERQQSSRKAAKLRITAQNQNHRRVRG